MTKPCTTCRRVKSVVEFSPERHGRWGGYYPQCKACRQAAQRLYRQRNLDRARAKGRAYAQVLYQRQREHFKEKIRRWNAANPEKRSAQLQIRAAIKASRLFAPSACSQCGATDSRIEAHHHDYSQPLVVTWLCKPCHVRADAVRRANERAA